jgi:hypothetical protein
MQIQDSTMGEAVAARLPTARAPAVAACGECAKEAQTAVGHALGDLARRLGADFSDVASTLRAWLTTAAAQGSDGVPDVLAKLERALEQTGRALRQAGYGEEQVRRALDGVREQLGAAAAASADVAAARATTYVRKDRASLAITTQDGDRVQIRFRSREGLVSQTAMTTGGGEERRVYAFASGRIEIAVQGELDDEELAAIGELVAKVESIAIDFFAGDVQKAFAAASSLGFDAEQIAGFALRLSTREALTRQVTGAAARPVTDRPAFAAPAKQPASAPAPRAQDVPAPMPADVAPETATAARAADADTAAVTDSASGVSASAPSQQSAAATGVRNTVADYLHGLLAKLATPAQVGRYTFSMRWKLEVVAAAVRAQEPAAQSGAASRLLTGSLEALGKRLSEPSPASAAA